MQLSTLPSATVARRSQPAIVMAGFAFGLPKMNSEWSVGTCTHRPLRHWPSRDGGLLLSGSADGTVYSQDIPFGTDPILLQDDAKPRIDTLSVSPDGRFAIIGSVVDNQETGLATVIDLGTGQQQRSLAGHLGHVRAIAISPDGAEIADCRR